MAPKKIVKPKKTKRAKREKLSKSKKRDKKSRVRILPIPSTTEAVVVRAPRPMRVPSARDKSVVLRGNQVGTCKAENEYQGPATLYVYPGIADPLGIETFRQIAGASLSFNNFCDLDRDLQTLTHIAASFEVNLGTVPKIAICSKHGNPCGAGVHHDPIVAM